MRLTARDDAKILIIRPDRIGDVVLSTPVFASIRKGRPGWKISVLASPVVAPLLEGHPDVDEVIRLSTADKPSFSNTYGLSQMLNARRFDVAVHLYSDFWISLAVWRAGVPLVIGPASKIAAIFYDMRIVQKRSKGGRHETDHNLDLLAPLGIPPVRKSFVPVKDGFAPPPGLLVAGKKNVGVFPGMGGSARNWKPANFARLADILAGEGMNVILVCGPGGEPLLSEVESLSKVKPAKFISSGLKELAAFIKKLDCFVAPSTGPLHIATAVGTPAVGIYCPIRVCLPERWGPIGEKDAALLPDAPVCEKCAPDKCEYFDCMDRLLPESVGQAVKERV
jgi:ADP-heptose:LPS heptosyltransferase